LPEIFGVSKNSVQYKRGIAAKYVIDLHRITTNVSLEVITLESMVDGWQISGLEILCLMKNYWIRDWLVRYEDEEGKGDKGH